MDMDRHKCCICSETWVSSFKIVQNLIQLVIGEEYEKGQKNIVWFQKGKLGMLYLKNGLIYPSPFSLKIRI